MCWPVTKQHNCLWLVIKTAKHYNNILRCSMVSTDTSTDRSTAARLFHADGP